MLAEVVKRGPLSMQVCVPSDWTNAQALKFADEENPCGTEHGWFIRKDGDKALAGMPERNPCAKRAGFVHIMLDAWRTKPAPSNEVLAADLIEQLLEHIRSLSAPVEDRAGEPMAWMLEYMGEPSDNIFRSQSEATRVMDRLNRDYPQNTEHRRLLPLYGPHSLNAAGEPVAWLIQSEDGLGGFVTNAITDYKIARENCDKGDPIPLYASLTPALSGEQNAAPKAGWQWPVNTVGKLIASLQTLPADMSLYTAYFVEIEGVKIARTINPSLSRETVSNSRIQPYSPENQSLVIWASQERLSVPAHEMVKRLEEWATSAEFPGGYSIEKVKPWLAEAAALLSRLSARQSIDPSSGLTIDRRKRK